MTPTIAFRVTHAPWSAARRALLLQLRQRLGPVGAPHSFAVIEDTQRQGCWPTVRATWISGAMTTATHVLAMQDDIHPCPAFIPALEILIGMRPDVPLALWTTRPQIEQIDGAWMACPGGSSGGGVVLPRAMAEDFIRWNDRYLPGRSDVHLLDDSRLGWYIMARGLTTYYPVPGLMNHYGVKSLLGHNTKSHLMQPRRFIGLDGDPLAIDWTRGFTDPPTAPVGRTAPILKTLHPRILVESGLARAYPALAAVTRSS